MIISLVLSAPPGTLPGAPLHVGPFMACPRRSCVLLSRAKAMLYVVASPDWASADVPFWADFAARFGGGPPAAALQALALPAGDYGDECGWGDEGSDYDGAEGEAVGGGARSPRLAAGGGRRRGWWWADDGQGRGGLGEPRKTSHGCVSYALDWDDE